MNLDQVKRLYFLGVGGIGMSALARWFNQKGCSVTGYDRTPTDLTDQLQSEGIQVNFRDEVENIPNEVRQDKETLVIYTPALSARHQQLQWFKERDYPLHKRSEVLGWITRRYFSIAVAGTHGKTTTSSMITHILHTAGKNCLAFIGGISANLNSNLLVNNSEKDVVVVVEADEFDRSFLQLSPSISIVTALDPDHLDVYGDYEYMIESYRAFIQRSPEQGSLILQRKTEKELKAFAGKRQVYVYALDQAPVRAENVHVTGDSFMFDFRSQDDHFGHLALSVPGFHNVENSLAAILACRLVGVDSSAIATAIGTYSGVKRRFEYIYRSKDLIYIDDYAHHPEEIRALLTSVKALYPGRKVTAVFQPHLYSRTRDFHKEFAQVLQLADHVLLLPIYPAREEPIAGVDSKMISREMKEKPASLVSKADLVDEVKRRRPEVLVTLGAGDIDRFPPLLKNALEVI